jgi:hypothetical protein
MNSMHPSMVDLVAALTLLIGIFLWNSTQSLEEFVTFLLEVAQIDICEQKISLLLHSEPIELDDLAGEYDLFYTRQSDWAMPV